METGSRRKNLLPVSIVIIPQKQPKYKSCTAMRRMLYSISNVERGMAMEKDWMVLLQQHNQLGQVLKLNRDTEKYGLVLSEQDAMMILKERENSLREQRRIEFGEGIISKIIYEFCDSDFIDQNNYVDTVIHLQEIFYLYKNEMEDEITDDELLHFMKEQFEEVCFGDLEYLEGTCLSLFAQAIRAGYQGYKASGGLGEYGRLDEVKRWDYELYMEALRELCWR